MPTPLRLWSHLTMDFVMDLPLSEGNTAILSIVDLFYKMVRFVPLAALLTALETADILFRQVPNRLYTPEHPRVRPAGSGEMVQGERTDLAGDAPDPQVTRLHLWKQKRAWHIGCGPCWTSEGEGGDYNIWWTGRAKVMFSKNNHLVMPCKVVLANIEILPKLAASLVAGATSSTSAACSFPMVHLRSVTVKGCIVIPPVHILCPSCFCVVEESVSESRSF
ncbi:hypothetical protein P4O66_012327 [Electrophorus voltai]|uniref:Uncharacterized protein n=1 Tax=Electrophorus voltai TaxID=2609070 RepID=A0AAD8Z6H5_9TELE|nr:hypothetical protein P4O66_012327 [Electrophorus voltai]